MNGKPARISGYTERAYRSTVVHCGLSSAEEINPIRYGIQRLRYEATGKQKLIAVGVYAVASLIGSVVFDQQIDETCEELRVESMCDLSKPLF